MGWWSQPRFSPHSGVHLGLVKHASPKKFTTSRDEILAQFFFHRAEPKVRGPERGYRSPFSVIAHVFSWPHNFDPYDWWYQIDRHSIRLLSALQRCCEYHKAVAIHGIRSLTCLEQFLPCYTGPHLEYAMEVNSSHLIADINHLGAVQRLVLRLVRGRRDLSYEERLHELNPFSSERRRL